MTVDCRFICRKNNQTAVKSNQRHMLSATCSSIVCVFSKHYNSYVKFQFIELNYTSFFYNQKEALPGTVEPLLGYISFLYLFSLALVANCCF